MIPGKKAKHPSFVHSFLFAMQGFRTAFTTERNIKVMVGGQVFAIVMSAILQVDLISWAIVLLSCGVVLAAELLNTAIETVVDLVSPEYHPLAGRAKDIAAGAVWTLCTLVALVGIIIFARAILIKLGML